MRTSSVVARAHRVSPPSTFARRSRSRTMSTVSRASEGDDAPNLLPWLARVTDDPALESRVALRHLGDARGRCLVALRNLTPDEVIFNVPFSLVFAEREDDARDDEDHLPWSARMAVRLLEERAAKGPLLPWIQSLPSRVSTPPLEYDDASLEACHDPAVIAEARDVAAAHARAADRLAPRLAAADADADDLRWAAGALHSRCFTHGPRGTHLAVPGVDMCNHRASNPTAVVRVVASPDACQGTVAAAEVADVDAAEKAVEERYFQLRANEEGVEEGEEVCISYGPWPNDPFFLYFGFVPEGNPNDAATLFEDGEDAAACAARLGLVDAAAAKTRARAARDAAAAVAAANGARDERMVITREGIDGGVVAAAEALGLDGWEALVEGRCCERLREFPTTLKEDRAALAEGRVSGEDEATAVRYRMSKKEVLLGPLAAAAARARAAERDESR